MLALYFHKSLNVENIELCVPEWLPSWCMCGEPHNGDGGKVLAVRQLGNIRGQDWTHLPVTFQIINLLVISISKIILLLKSDKFSTF